MGVFQASFAYTPEVWPDNVKQVRNWTKISVGNKGKPVDTSEQCELQFTLFNE